MNKIHVSEPKWGDDDWESFECRKERDLPGVIIALVVFALVVFFLIGVAEFVSTMTPGSDQHRTMREVTPGIR
jgi:hypothetical protein